MGFCVCGHNGRDHERTIFLGGCVVCGCGQYSQDHDLTEAMYAAGRY